MRTDTLTRIRTRIGIAAVAVIGAAMALVGASAANAATSYNGAYLAYEQTFFAYANAGELPQFAFTQVSGQATPVDFTVTAPDGTVQQTCHVAASSPKGTACASSGLTPSVSGVWTIHYNPNRPDPGARYDWVLNVVDDQGRVVPGRTWVDSYGMYQSAAANIQLWLATPDGYVYKADFRGYNGIGSWIKSNGFGLVDAGTCTPIYHSVEGSISGANGVYIDPRYAYSDGCGDPYKLFLEDPNPDLPATATTPTGTDWVRPAVVAPAATDLTLQQNTPTTRAGSFTFDLAGVNGGYTVQIDTNGNGTYTDAVDRTIPWGSPPGHVSVPFDGRDGQGNPLNACAAMHARVVVDRVGEAHLVLDDVETLGTSSVNNYGIKITGDTPGIVSANPKLYWDDTNLVPRNSSEKPLPYADGRAGVDTTQTVTGAHGWGQWGDTRSIENWTYYQAQAGDETAIAPSCVPGISVVKSATPSDASSYTVGQKITYSYAVTNTGNADLSNVAVTEAAFSGSGPAPVVSCPGDALAVGAQMICSAGYTLTQDDIDAGSLSNSAVADGDSTGEHITSEPSEVTIPRDPHPGISLAKSVTPATASAAGDEVTYGFTITNTGDVTLTKPVIAENAFTGTGSLSAVECPDAAAVLTPGEITTCTARYTLTQADVDAGRVDNTAVVTAQSPADEPVESAPAGATVSIAANPAITLTKSADHARVTGTEQSIRYSFAVTNTGNVTVDGLAIEESAFTGAGTLSAVDCPVTTIAPHATAVCTADYRTVSSDVTAGQIENTAQATGAAPSGTTIDSDPSSVTVTVGAPATSPGASSDPGGKTKPTALAATGGPTANWAVLPAAVAVVAGVTLLFIRRTRRARG
jgi:hypothetical protein